MFMDMPQRRIHNVEIELVDSFKNRKKYNLRFASGTIEYLQDFLWHVEGKGGGISVRIHEFMKDKVQGSSSIDWRIIAINVGLFLEIIENTLFKDVFNAPTESQGKKSQEDATGRFGAVLLHCCKVTNETLLGFTQKYTYGQMLRILENSEYYENMKSKEGRSKNKVKDMKKKYKEMTAEQKDAIQKRLEESEKYSFIK